MRKKLAILGASGHGKVVADTAELLGYDCVFFDDAWPKLQNNSHWQVVGDTETLLDQASCFAGVVVAIGNNDIRLGKINLLQKQGIFLPHLIHPHACISRYASVDSGTVIFSGVVVNADTKIGRGVILNTSSSVDHDCILEDAVHLSPGAHLAGGVKVGACTWIGIGATVRQLVIIGKNSIVAGGATVVNDISDSVTVAGTPAKKLSTKN